MAPDSKGIELEADASLEECASAVNDTVGDHTLRNLHILAGV